MFRLAPPGTVPPLLVAVLKTSRRCADATPVGAPWTSGYRRLRIDVPAAHWSLAILYVGGGLACLYSVIAPIGLSSNTAPKVVVAIAAIAGAVAILALGRRLTRPYLLAGGAAASAVVTLLVAEADTGYGVGMAAIGYLWVSVYTGLFFSARAVVGQTALIAVGMGAALIATGRTDLSLAWVMFTFTALVFAVLPQRLSHQLRTQARTDALTGVLNRRGLAAVAARLFAKADRHHRPVTAVMLDLDRFKQVNDDFGHVAGDRLLVDVAESLATGIGPSNVLARTGGDEFLALLADTTPREAAETFARLAEQSTAKWSVGIAARCHRENLDACVTRVARALRVEKQSRRLRLSDAPPLPGRSDGSDPCAVAAPSD